MAADPSLQHYVTLSLSHCIVAADPSLHILCGGGDTSLKTLRKHYATHYSSAIPFVFIDSIDEYLNVSLDIERIRGFYFYGFLYIMWRARPTLPW